MPSKMLENFTHNFAKWAGSASGFLIALLSIICWVIAGISFKYAQIWLNGLTLYMSVITFLMVFLIQRSQNKELAILHVKLNELISATKKADNRLINVEHLSEQEISEVQDIQRKIGQDEAQRLS